MRWERFPTIVNAGLGKLFVGKAENSDMAIFGKIAFYATHKTVGSFFAGTVAHVNGELKHQETITYEVLTEFRTRLALFFRARRKIKLYEYPHGAILIDSKHGNKMIAMIKRISSSWGGINALASRGRQSYAVPPQSNGRARRSSAWRQP